MIGRDDGVPGQITHHLFRKNIITELNGYDESLKFNEDFELILRIAKKWKFLGINKIGFIQHIRKDSWSNSNPYTAYNGVEKFLKTALNRKLLPLNEIDQRSKENRLSLVKNLLLQRNRWNEVSPSIDEAFDIMKPQNYKEFILFIMNKILKSF